MKRLLNRHEELAFTVVAYSLLCLVLLCFLTVRLTKESYAKLLEGPSVLSVYPSSVVPGADQRVTVLSERTHFGPETTVRPEVFGVAVSAIRFTSEREMSFNLHILDSAGFGEGSEIPLRIRSPKQEGMEEVPLRLKLSIEAEPIELDLFNLGGERVVTTDRDFILFGYRPRGYGPFRFLARNLESGKVHTQETRNEIEHFGIKLKPGENPFELVLSDTLGREVREMVLVTSETSEGSENLLTRLGLVSVCHAQSPSYNGKPTQWGSEPTEQMAASDCVLGNGPLGCAGNCSGSLTSQTVKPPPNDYLTSIGEAETRGDTVLLHNGQYREDVVDLYIPGRGLDFTWRRSYQSGINLDGYLGKNWDFSWGAHFIVEYANMTIPTKGRFSRGDCRRDLYDNTSLVGGAYVFSTLPVGYVDINTAVYTSYSEVRQTKRNGFRQIFDQATGNLKSREDRYGNKLTVIYSAGGKISRIKDTLDRYIDFLYYDSGDGSGRLSKISDFAGRTVTYEYKTEAGAVVLTKVLYPTTTWYDDTVAQPWPEKTTTSRTHSYQYDSSTARLSIMIDGRGKQRVRNVYDSNGRLDYQYNYSSGAFTHDFVFGIQNGKVTKANYKNRPGNETAVFFDASNHLSTKREVYYTSEGVANTATTLITRGCTCTLPTAIQEPDGGYTTFTINSNGDVTEKRQCADLTPPNSGLDIVRKAYFAAVNSTAFGVVTKTAGPKGFASGASESNYWITITYDLVGNPVTIAYPDTTNPNQNGHTKTNTYNSNGQLLTISNPEGILTTFTYYGAGDTPANNLGYLKQVKVKYNGAGNEVITSYTHNSFGGTTKVKDPNGNEATFDVDNQRLVTAVTKATPFNYVEKRGYNGERALVKYDLENRKGTQARDTANEWWEKLFILNDAGGVATRKSEISSSTWQEVISAFDAEFRVTKRTDGRGKQSLFTLDERGFAVRATHAPGSGDESIIKLIYDNDGKVVKTSKAFRNYGDGSDTNVINRIVYDMFDRKEKTLDHETDGASNYKQFYYDLASMVTMLEEYGVGDATPLRRTESFFDELDRSWKTIRGVTERDSTKLDVTTLEYDKANRLTKRTDDNSQIRKTEFDNASRVVKTILPPLTGGYENYVTFEYDKNSNLTRRVSTEINDLDPLNPEDHEWITVYDQLNRPYASTFYGDDGTVIPNPTHTVTYDTRNVVVAAIDVDGVQTTHDYDGLIRRTKTTYNSGGTNPAPITVTTAYDLSSNVTAKTDSESKTTTYAFDDQNRLTRTTHHDNDFIDVSYNKLGLAMTKRYANGGTQKQSTEYRYDDIGLNTRRNVSWGTTPTWAGYDDYKTTAETFGFDGTYRLVSASDNDSEVTFVWNSLNQLDQERLRINLRSGSIDNWKATKTKASTWDDTGRRRKTVTYPISGKKFEYSHDCLDRITEIRLDGTPDKAMARYWYEGPGLKITKRDRGLELDAVPANTFRTLFTDDPLKRNTQMKHLRDTGSLTSLRILDYTWGNDSAGRKYQRSTYYMSDATSYLTKHDLNYDNVGRLSMDKWVHASPQEDYKYYHSPVQFHQKREKTVSMTTTVEREYTERTDGSHQMDSFTNPSTSCTFDECGNMVTQGSTSYYYDHNNRLVHIDGTTDLWFRYDALGRRIVEKAGTSETLFYYDGGHIVEETNNVLSLIRWSLFGISLDEILYTWGPDDGGTNRDHWPLTDHLGSVVQVVDNSGGNLARFNYLTAYGAASIPIGDSSRKFPYGFTGRRRILADSEIYDYRTRAYEPGCGRFLQRDSIGIWRDPKNVGNGYAVAGNDPVNLLDPFGSHAQQAPGGGVPEATTIPKPDPGTGDIPGPGEAGAGEDGAPEDGNAGAEPRVNDGNRWGSLPRLPGGGPGGGVPPPLFPPGSGEGAVQPPGGEGGGDGGGDGGGEGGDGGDGGDGGVDWTDILIGIAIGIGLDDLGESDEMGDRDCEEELRQCREAAWLGAGAHGDADVYIEALGICVVEYFACIAIEGFTEGLGDGLGE